MTISGLGLAFCYRTETSKDKQDQAYCVWFWYYCALCNLAEGVEVLVNSRHDRLLIPRDRRRKHVQKLAK